MCLRPVLLSSTYPEGPWHPLFGSPQREVASRDAHPEVLMARFTWRVIWRSFASLTVLFLCVGASIPAKPGALDPHAQNRVGRLAADSTIVILLGTGTPGPDPTAFGPATAVVIGSRVFLFDAGVGVMRRMVAAK